MIISGECYHDLVWPAVNSEIAVGTLFVFLAMAPIGVPIIVKFDDDSRLMAQPGGVAVPLPLYVCESMK